jgi:hypothetical protein
LQIELLSTVTSRFTFFGELLDVDFHEEQSTSCAIAIVDATDAVLLHSTAIVVWAQLPDFQDGSPSIRGQARISLMVRPHRLPTPVPDSWRKPTARQLYIDNCSRACQVLVSASHKVASAQPFRRLLRCSAFGLRHALIKFEGTRYL